MGDIYFKTTDDDTAIRFYPYGECIIGGVADTTVPTISLVTLSPTTVVLGGLVTVTVVATDASGMVNVVVNGLTGTDRRAQLCSQVGVAIYGRARSQRRARMALAP